MNISTFKESGDIIMKVYERIVNKKNFISIIGLGYVGLPLALEFAKKVDVIGFDIDEHKINEYRRKKDRCNIVDKTLLKESNIFFTADEKKLDKSVFHIVAVPTPIKVDKTPDLRPLEDVCMMLGKHLNKGAYVVFESTVYPGVTEDFCIPILEKYSNLVCGVDFKVGYSPERINPGDEVNTVAKITKVVSGIDEEALEQISDVYELVIDAGVHRVSNIKVAEASKALENAQRDINIAFMNEISKMFDKLGIDTFEVLRASSTKWNFLNFTPGLVGGHCIGVDPYYLMYMSEQIGIESQVIMAGRKINESMGRHIGEKVIELLAKEGKTVLNANVLILGIAFKENVSDIRNTKVIDIIKKLNEFKINTTIVDPLVDKHEVFNEYGISMGEVCDAGAVDGIVLAVPHNKFKNIDLREIKEKYCNKKCIFVDVKGVLNSNYVKELDMTYWRL